MKTEKKIFIAFLLNLSFSVFEFVGGAVTGSIAILSDAVHDMGDAAGIGVACLLERKSQCPPDHTHTYGYARYSVLGSFITTVILLFGSAVVIYNAIGRILVPVAVNHKGMVVFAAVGVVLNFLAAYITRDGDSMNQKAVNLHMLEDVLGWVVVLMGAVVMGFTHITVIDPLMSLGVALFIVVHCVKNLRKILDLFLDKTPAGISVEEIRASISEIHGVKDVHHIHIRSLDGQNHEAAMHIAADGDVHVIKEQVHKKLEEYGIVHVTLSLEDKDEDCHARQCHAAIRAPSGHHHH